MHYADVASIKKKIIGFVVFILFLVVGLAFLYNVYSLFFPISLHLESDSAEHLHAAYLLSIGERPYLDFIQNHPMLFQHFLVWIEKAFNISGTRELAIVARTVLFANFLICLVVFALWTSRIVKDRPKGLIWAGTLLAAWAMLDIYNPDFYWMWDIRPDFICYGQTLLGLFFVYLWIENRNRKKSAAALTLGIIGGFLIGFGNAIIPKGIPFLGGFALSLVILGISGNRNILTTWLDWKTLGGAIAIGLTVVFSFAIGMALDCLLSNIPIHTWYTAVFTLNSQKNIIFSNIEDNPITPLLDAFSIPLPLVIVLIGWIVWELINFNIRNNNRNSHPQIWLFAIFTILINLILPVFSNGVTWNYYYIPSILSQALICLMLLLRLAELCKKHPFKGSLKIYNGAIILLIAFVVIQITNVPLYSIAKIGERKAAAKEVDEISPDDFLTNDVLPEDFVYLGFPYQIPTKSRDWGYYLLLPGATNFWEKCYDLGLGPDPQEAWKKGFGGNPPDAIAITTPDLLSELIFKVKKCHRLDISWLLDEIRERYVLVERSKLSLYVLKDHLPLLEARGWQKVSE